MNNVTSATLWFRVIFLVKGWWSFVLRGFCLEVSARWELTGSPSWLYSTRMLTVLELGTALGFKNLVEDEVWRYLLPFTYNTRVWRTERQRRAVESHSGILSRGFIVCDPLQPSRRSRMNKGHDSNINTRLYRSRWVEATPSKNRENLVDGSDYDLMSDVWTSDGIAFQHRQSPKASSVAHNSTQPYTPQQPCRSVWCTERAVLQRMSDGSQECEVYRVRQRVVLTWAVHTEHTAIYLRYTAVYRQRIRIRTVSPNLYE